MASDRLQSWLVWTAVCGIGLLFAVKYASRYGIPWIAGAMGYLGLFLVVLWTCRCKSVARFLQRPEVFFPLLVLVAAALAVAMLQYNPLVPSNGRAPAIREWLSRFLDGIYPYASPTQPSSFPFLFVLALPFILMGEVGWLQIVAFVVLGFLLFSVHRSTAPEKLALIVTSPAFLHEVIVRSELISNMIVVILYLWLCERTIRDHGRTGVFLLGLLGGLVLSTRGVVLAVYAVYFVYVFRGDVTRGLFFALGVLVSFAATLAPFVVWDAYSFIHNGPFAIQASYLSPILIAATLFVAVAWGLRARSSGSMWAGVSIVLLAPVLITFAQTVILIGWSDAVWQNKFDISYFTFSLPFLIWMRGWRKLLSVP